MGGPRQPLTLHSLEGVREPALDPWAVGQPVREPAPGRKRLAPAVVPQLLRRRAYPVDLHHEDLARRAPLVGRAGVLVRHPVDELEVLVRLDVDHPAAYRQPVPAVVVADDRDRDLRPDPERLALARPHRGADEDVLA